MSRNAGPHSNEIGRYAETVDFTDDLVGAHATDEDGDADLVVVFPPDPVDIVLGGERAEITVLHDKLDPIQRTAVEVSAQVAVNELKLAILQGVVEQALGSIDSTSSVSRGMIRSLGGTDLVDEDSLDELGTAIDAAESALDDVDEADGDAELESAVAELEQRTAAVLTMAGDVLTLDPSVAVRPFQAATENLLREPTSADDFFAPSALALLLQHLGVTFAALAIVRDDRIGLLEIYRVGPVGARHVLAGKYAAYLVIGATVGAALIAAVMAAVDVPPRGSIAWVAGVVALLLVASIGLGFTLSAIARTDSQAVQYAMLALLASLFFGGFFLSLDLFSYPVKVLSWTLPVTDAIRALQDVMLRGVPPASIDLLGLFVTAAVYGAVATILFGRRLRIR